MKKWHPIVLALTVLTIMLAAMGGFYLQPKLKSAHADNSTVVNVWMTTPDQTNLLAQQASTAFTSSTGSSSNSITIDENQTYQQMVGFGASLTDSSASLISNSTQGDALMHRLFDPYPADPNGIGLSFLRQPMGASDFTSVGDYSYDEPSSGQTADPNLTNFKLGQDTQYIIPLLQKALQYNPNLKIMATPWSPPGWIKTNLPNSQYPMRGGTFNTTYYDTYANYFVKFIQAYKNVGVPIYAITPQNEPLNSTGTYPSMSMPVSVEQNFIQQLGTTFANQGISTKIIAYDHNWQSGCDVSVNNCSTTPTTDYTHPILSDSNTLKYVAGVAFHCYDSNGDSTVQNTVYGDYPSGGHPNDIYLTECTGHGDKNSCPSQAQNASSFGGDLGWETQNLIIGAIRNWAKTVTLWNMALDPNCGPQNGANANLRGIVTLDPNSGNITYNVEYYVLGHISKFVVPNAYRIYSTACSNGNSSSGGSNTNGNVCNKGGIENVAFKNPDGSKVLIAYNPATITQPFDMQWGTKSFTYSLPAGAVATFQWAGTQDTLSRAGWTATASPASPTNTCCQDDVAMHAIDGDATTRWSTGQAQTNGQYFQVDMATAQSFSGIVMDTGNSSSGDYPRAYQVFVSNDGSNWGNLIDNQTRSGQLTKDTFPTTQTARYIKVVQTGTSGNWWSIAEFNVITAPNLFVTTSLSAPSTATLDQPFTASYAVTNTGTAPFNLKSLYIAMHELTNGVDTGTLIADLGGDNNATPIGPGQSRTITLTTPNLAGGCSGCGGGAYTLFASVLMPDGSWWNPQAANGAVNRVQVNVATLTVTSGISAPSTAMLHQSFTASYTVTNTGTAPFTLTSLYIAMHELTNGVDTGTLIADLGGDNNATPIQPGESRTITLTTPNLAGNCGTCGGGTYTVFASVLMPDGSWWNPQAANGAVNRVSVTVS